MKNVVRITEISTEEDLIRLIEGGAFLGSGGGGPMNMALELKDYILKFGKTVRVVQPESLTPYPNKTGAIAAFMGSPEAGSHGLDFSTPTNAFVELAKLAENQTMDFGLLIEIGALNSLVPVSIAASRDIPVVDCDGAGRAVPKLQNTTYAQGISAVPAALANGAREGYPTIGNIIEFSDVAWEDLAQTLEDYCLSILGIPAFGQVGGLAAYMTKGSQVEENTISGTLSLSYGIGKAIRDAIGLGQDVPKAVSNYLTGLDMENYLFPDGVVTEVHKPSGDGNLDVGYVIVEDSAKNQMKISYENENLYATLNGKIWGMAPDLICYVGPAGSRSNVEIAVGMPISVIGVAANEKIRIAPIIQSFMQELQSLEIYSGPYIPIEKLHP